MTIVHTNYIEVLPTTDQMTCIQKKLMDLILEGVNSTVCPQFEGCERKHGWMNEPELTRMDKQTASRFKVNGISQLKIVEEKESPRSEVMIVHLPNYSEL